MADYMLNVKRWRANIDKKIPHLKDGNFFNINDTPPRIVQFSPVQNRELELVNAFWDQY